MPPKVYGGALPPGLESTTRGELRIRVDKLILDDIALNRNPLIRFNLGGNAGSAASQADSPAGGGAAHVSPNKFVVPVDYCAISPLFWGEPKPSAYCQPATPGQPGRGPATLVYPIKSSAEHFADYLTGMSRSPHCGLQMEVYVPSSYSGRPAVPVGKSIIFLEQLSSRQSMTGWYSVVHSQPSDGISAATSDGGDTQYFTVGKMKLHMLLEFFPGQTQSRPKSHSSARASSLNTSRERNTANSSMAEETGQGLDQSAAASTQDVGHQTDSSTGAKTRKKSRPAGMNVSFPSERGAKSASHDGNDSSSSSSSIEVDMTGIEGSDGGSSKKKNPSRKQPAARGMPPAAEAPRSTAAHQDPLERDLRRQEGELAVSELVSRGLRLRERMAKAVDTSFEAHTGAGLAVGGGVPDGECGHEHRHGRRCNPKTPSEEVEEDEDTMYSSEESDEERFALHLQREQRMLRQREEQQAAAAAASATLSVPAAGTHADRSSNHAASLPYHQQRQSQQAIKVELCFSDFSFAATPMTADLTEMRLSVRLSKDITTEEPASGPFSSYVHRVPLSQTSICLTFDIRSYSEEVSRLVIELIKVTSSTVQESVVGGSGVVRRQVVAEEPLGLCIVGVFAQKRELALRDPITSLVNAYCNMSLALTNNSSNSNTTGTNNVSGPLLNRSGDVVNMSAVSRGSRSRGGMNTPEGSRSSSSSSSATDSAASSPSSRSSSTVSASQGNAGARHHHRHQSTRARDGSRKRRHRPPPSAPSTSSASQVSLREVAGARVSHALSSQRVQVQRPLVTLSCSPRLCVAIQRAVQLPRVSLASSAGPAPALSRAGPEKDDGYTLPNAFFLVDAVLPPSLSSRAVEGMGRSVLVSGDAGLTREVKEIEGWTIDSYAHGFYDRTAVVAASQKPVFNYSCVLALPPLPVSVANEELTGRKGKRQHDAQHSLTDGGDHVAVHDELFKRHLGELKLSLWHHVPAPETGVDVVSPLPNDGARRGHAEETETEIQFWTASAQLGECRVDLKPLRYLNRLDGFYQITSQLPVFAEEEEVAAGFAGDSHVHTSRLSAAGPPGSSQTIGHVHVSVWLA